MLGDAVEIKNRKPTGVLFVASSPNDSLVARLVQGPPAFAGLAVFHPQIFRAGTLLGTENRYKGELSAGVGQKSLCLV